MGCGISILNTSSDATLLSIRSAYLVALGFEVVGARSIGDLPGRGKYLLRPDFAVLCYTLSDTEKLSWCRWVEQNWPSTQIMELYMANPPVTPHTALDPSQLQDLVKSLTAEVAEQLIC